MGRQEHEAGMLGLGQSSRRHLPGVVDMCRSHEGMGRLGPGSDLSWGAVAAKLGHLCLVPQVIRNGEDFEAATTARLQPGGARTGLE